jgi:ABC-2 type transport system ATP-binding protein
MAAPLLKIERLRVDFTEVVAVENLSLEIEPGDLCGLIGPNGAGKTTVLRAAAGLQEFTRGAVEVDGHPLGREPDECKRRLGFIPDSAPVHDRLTAAEFLDHFARAFGLPQPARRIERCLEQVWLAEKRNALCGDLSRGMKQRLLLARTLLPDPQVLLLDEPANGLDPLGRMDLWKLLLLLRDAGKAILISAPILAELASFCNKAAILERGRLLAFGPVASLGRTPDRRRMSVSWRANGARAAHILNTLPGVMDLIQAGQGATFHFEGDADAADNLLRQLILQEVHVTEWRSLEGGGEPVCPRPGSEDLR